QRGRRRSSSESSLRPQVDRIAVYLLQRGRRRSSSERARQARERRGRNDASTGPTTFVVGELGQQQPRARRSAGGFNGADDVRRRRGTRQAEHIGNSVPPLQRGRR